jgi:hypothetical protein
MANTTFNPSDKSAGITLSGGNLIASTTVASGAVRTIDAQVVGKFYWEFTLTSFALNGAVGFGTAAAAFVQFLNLTTTTALRVTYTGGQIYLSSAIQVGALGTLAAGNVIGIAQDLDRRIAFFRVAPSGNWNGSATADPVSGAQGIDFSSIGGLGTRMFPMVGSQGNPASLTANFGDTAFSGVVPSGYTAGFPAGATIPDSAWTAGMVRETLFATDGTLRTSGLVREVLRSTSTGAGTYLAVDGMVREMLRSGADAPRGGPMISLIM